MNQSFLYGEALPRVPNPYPFIYQLFRKKLSLSIVHLQKDYYIIFDRWVCSRYVESSFSIPRWQFSLHFCILQLLKSIPFYILIVWKKYPFREEPPCVVHFDYREYPPGTREGQRRKIAKGRKAVPLALPNHPTLFSSSQSSPLDACHAIYWC